MEKVDFKDGQEQEYEYKQEQEEKRGAAGPIKGVYDVLRQTNWGVTSSSKELTSWPYCPPTYFPNLHNHPSTILRFWGAHCTSCLHLILSERFANWGWWHFARGGCQTIEALKIDLWHVSPHWTGLDWTGCRWLFLVNHFIVGSCCNKSFCIGGRNLAKLRDISHFFAAFDKMLSVDGFVKIISTARCKLHYIDIHLLQHSCC